MRSFGLVGVGQIVTARLPERDVEPEEASLGAQCSNALSLVGVEPVEDLCHHF